jgi:hypothetical protein
MYSRQAAEVRGSNWVPCERAYDVQHFVVKHLKKTPKDLEVVIALAICLRCMKDVS